MNSRNIPLELENIIRKRDTQCVYCGSLFNNISKKTQATREHIINDERIITYDNIALCCSSCNASKGAKLLSNWIDSDYCKKKSISFNCCKTSTFIVFNTYFSHCKTSIFPYILAIQRDSSLHSEGRRVILNS